jgi:hypothetical protein
MYTERNQMFGLVTGRRQCWDERRHPPSTTRTRVKFRPNPRVVLCVVDTATVIAALLLAGVAGMLVGLLWAPIGIAAAIGLTLLSIGAVLAVPTAVLLIL